jgi:S-methylmethionine-dependent homocysteine/selenocysteine methylase
MNTPMLPSSTTTSSKLLRDLIRSFLFHDHASLGTTNRRRRKHNRVLLLDGGTGEELIAQGVPYDSKIWSARAITDVAYHTTVQKVHTSFILSGCDAITTNTYGIVPGVGFTKTEIAQYCSVAGRIAQRAVHDASTMNRDAPIDINQEYPAFVLGSLGPLVESYRADNIMSRSEGIEYYTMILQALQPYVDAFIAETLSSSEEAIQVLQSLSNHISHNQCHTTTTTDALFISFTVSTEGSLRSNESIISAMSNVLDYQKSNASNVQRK